MKDMKLVQTTHGVVLDPFSIMMGGLTRMGIGSKEKTKQDGFWDNIHGEVKFKQAFINACHFADTMTVVGPVAQLRWGNHIGSTPNAVWWGCPDGVGDNGLFFDEVRRFLQANPHIDVPEEAFDLPYRNCHYLNVMPDALLRMTTPDSNSSDTWLERIHHHLFDTRHFHTYSRGPLHPSSEPAFERGSPVVALMAVIFSFKRPGGVLEVSELTNLGGWPPVCFFLPVLVPAGTKVYRSSRSWSLNSEVSDFVTETQPEMVSYQLRITPEKEYSKRTVPYGQPYRLRSVERWGKPSDILRSLADVLRALWSQATQYCAWNTQWEWQDVDPLGPYPESVVGDLSLDPMGSGRRIRGHNRFSGKYDLYGLSMIWEDVAGGTPTMWGNKGRSLDPVTDLSIYNNMPGRNMMFVLPSFFDDETVTNITPVAVTLARYALTGNQVGHLSDFLTGVAVENTYPRDVNEDESPEITPKSFSDFMMLHQGVEQNTGPLPVQVIPSRVAFDKEGTPEVFGLRFHDPNYLMTSRQGLTLSNASDIYHDMEHLEDFKFMDAFCSSNSKDLSDTFEQAKKTKRGSTSSKSTLVDDEVVVDLFGGASDDGML